MWSAVAAKRSLATRACESSVARSRRKSRIKQGDQDNSNRDKKTLVTPMQKMHRDRCDGSDDTGDGTASLGRR
jgi:hypothetical protein